MIVRFCVLFLVSASFLAQDRDGTPSVEVDEKKIGATNPKIKPTFPRIHSETCIESCSPHIIALLYQNWSEDTTSLEDPLFTPILYWKDKDRDPISYLGSTDYRYSSELTDDDDGSCWTCPTSGPDCQNLAWYMENCHLSKDFPIPSFTFYLAYEATLMTSLTWHRSSCDEFMGPNATVLEENIPFLGGRVNGIVAIVNNVTEIIFPDPTSGSCWNPFCDEVEYQTCLEDAQLGLVEVSLDDFVGIKDVWCE